MFEFFDTIYEFISSGIYDLLKGSIAWLIEKALIAYYTSATWSLQFAWDIAETILTDLNISATIITYFDALPQNTKQIMAFFKIPEFINLVVSAFTTRLVLRFVPFI